MNRSMHNRSEQSENIEIPFLADFVNPFTPPRSPNMSRESDTNDYDAFAHNQLFADPLAGGNVAVHEWNNNEEETKETRISEREFMPFIEPRLLESETCTGDATHTKTPDDTEMTKESATLSIAMNARFQQSICDGAARMARPPRAAAKPVGNNSDEEESGNEETVTSNGSDASWREAKQRADPKGSSNKRTRTRKKYVPDSIVFVEYNEKDVLCQRGGLANSHKGNIRYHKVKEGLQTLYEQKSKEEKWKVSTQLVDAVHAWGGRFLEQDKNTGRWFEIHNKKARIKASQALRERYTKAQRAAKRQRYRAKKLEIETDSISV